MDLGSGLEVSTLPSCPRIEESSRAWAFSSFVTLPTYRESAVKRTGRLCGFRGKENGVRGPVVQVFERASGTTRAGRVP